MSVCFRYLVFRSRQARTHLCVVAARDQRHALQIARRIWTLPRTAFALMEGSK